MYPLLASLVGCIHAPMAQGGVAPGSVPAPSPLMVASCQKTMDWHNAWVVAGAVFGGLSGAGGAADALTTNKTAQTGVGIGVIGSGIFGAVATTAAGVTANTYATEGCAQILQQAVNAGQ
jgi:hypothetical protein